MRKRMAAENAAVVPYYHPASKVDFMYLKRGGRPSSSIRSRF